MTEQTNTFAAAFVEAQKEMKTAKKDSTNPFFKSKYADINAVHEASIPALHKHGIAPLQPIIQKDGKSYVRTILLHCSGQTMEAIGIPPCDVEILFSKQNDAQAQGSAITYARRYGLQSLVNIGAEDDDGNGTKGDDVKEKSPAAPLKRLASAIDGDMQEMQKAENEKQFRRIKDLVESCGSVEELQGVWEANAKPIAQIKKYASNLSQLLLESKDAMKLKFIGE